MNHAGRTLALVLTLASSSFAADKGDPWAPYRFLMGEWEGDGSGQPGKGTGGFSFAPDLQGKILVRRNRAEFPPSAGRPTAVHEDLMVVYRGEKGEGARAVYFDSEGHVIHYTPSASDDGRTLTFLSEASPSSPRFRLTYRKEGEKSVHIKFEMAPPGQPEKFATYLEGKAHRVKEPQPASR
jgi:hypothetical protein